jgi:hypothetical protein
MNPIPGAPTMQKLKLDLELLSVQAFDTMPGLAVSDLRGGNSDASPAGTLCNDASRRCSDDCGGTAFAHQNDTMPDKDPDSPDRSTQKEQQRDPGLQSYTSGGGDGAAADPEQNIIIEDDPRYEKPKEKDEK